MRAKKRKERYKVRCGHAHDFVFVTFIRAAGRHAQIASLHPVYDR